MRWHLSLLWPAVLPGVILIPVFALWIRQILGEMSSHVSEYYIAQEHDIISIEYKVYDPTGQV